MCRKPSPLRAGAVTASDSPRARDTALTRGVLGCKERLERRKDRENSQRCCTAGAWGSVWGQGLPTSLGSSLWPARSLKSGGLHSCDHAVNSRAARRGTAPAGARGGFPLGSSKDRASAGLLQQHRAPAPASSSPPFPQPPCTWELQ